MLPTTGSMMAQAISWPFSAKMRSTAAKSLKGAVRVSFASADGTPGESGRPSVSTPLPAFTRNGSPAPWKQPSNLRMYSRPVKPRATRMAATVASVPLETRRTFSTLGTVAHSSSASSTSPGVGAP